MKKGFAIIELLIVVALTSFISVSIAMPCVYNHKKIIEQYNEIEEQQQQQQYIIDGILEEM